jgi:hypothetical protein
VSEVQDALGKLAALSEEVAAAYRRWWDEEDWARSFELYDELEAARKSYRVALAECWPQLEASKYLPDYPEVIRGRYERNGGDESVPRVRRREIT